MIPIILSINAAPQAVDDNICVGCCEDIVMTNDSTQNRILHERVVLLLGEIGLDGELRIPKDASSIIMFVHGSGSSRLSPRNQYIAGELNKHGLATLLFDLLSAKEEALDQHAMMRFDIRFLARRVVAASRWLREYDETENLNLGYFGASTGAAAALVAAAALPEYVSSIVSRGGRPDLAGTALEQVKAPTLLIVGGLDKDVIELNRQSATKLKCDHHLEIVPGATHLFEEPGTLETVANLAADWFSRKQAH